MFFSDIRMPLVGKTQPIKVLNDSVIKNNGVFLTQLLQYNSGIYFKENGPGMSSSASFRGTTAQQTEVLWNGISINSKFLGLTDFNAISTQTYDEVAVKPGGASVIYGSGAIGGTIHLNQKLKFNQPLQQQLSLSSGSYNLSNSSYQMKWGKQKWATEFAFGFNRSDNDFKWSSPDYQNENGQYNNQTASLSVAHKSNSKNSFSLFTQWYNDQRYLSLFSPNQPRTQYKNRNVRTLFQWNFGVEKFKHNVSIAFLNEQYRYFENIETHHFTGGSVNTYLTKYTGTYQFNPKISLTGLIDNTYDKGKGKGTGIENPSQNKFQLAGLFRQTLNNTLFYELGLKKVLAQNFTSPLLFSVGISLKENNFTTTKINLSKNFRQPSINDLYWQPGGNQNLKAETALQGELIQELKIKSFKLSLTGFYYDINDLIRWVPTNSQFWEPQNVDNVTTYGTECSFSWQESWGMHSLKFNGNYAFNISKNRETQKQLPYVPKNKGSGNISYSFWRINTFLQGVYIGHVFTQNDNLNRMGEYAIVNWGIRYTNPKEIEWELGIIINNLTNTRYEVVEYRPMPPLNYNVSFNIKI